MIWTHHTINRAKRLIECFMPEASSYKDCMESTSNNRLYTLLDVMILLTKYDGLCFERASRTEPACITFTCRDGVAFSLAIWAWRTEGAGGHVYGLCIAVICALRTGELCIKLSTARTVMSHRTGEVCRSYGSCFTVESRWTRIKVPPPYRNRLRLDSNQGITLCEQNAGSNQHYY